jgi:G3E family GTPase
LNAPIPVTIVGGYLGAGKTTLVNHLLRRRGERRIAVLVNDFGELAIDAELIESRDGTLLQLAGGCVCCSFGSDLMAALQRIRELQPAPDHILLECSGVALPGAVARTLTLLKGLALDAVLVLADAETLRERAADRYVGELLKQQLREADLIALNKLDLAAPGDAQALPRWLAEAAPRARVLPCRHAQLPPALALGLGLGKTHVERERTAATPLALAGAGHGGALFTSLSLEFEHAVDTARLAAALLAPGLGLLRAKGLMRGTDGLPCSLQLVGARCVVAPSAHARPRQGRLVGIGLQGCFDAADLRAALRVSSVA